MSATCTKHTRSKIMKETLDKIIILYHTPVVMVTLCSEHTRSRNMEATCERKNLTIVNPQL